MPKLVYINISTLKTLSDREFHSGLGEVIKHGLICDASYYKWVRDNKENILARDENALALVVEGSCRIKRAVVEEDPKEQGIRALLNFGHTFGHSIEKLMEFQLTHGECVAIGCILAAGMSRDRGYLTEAQYTEIKNLFQYFGFPKLPEELDSCEVINETRHDKKMAYGSIRFILLRELGKAEIFRDVTEEEMAAAFLSSGEQHL